MSATLSHPDWKESLRDVVCDCVRMHLPQGLQRAQATAARAIGISPRRVRAWWQREVRQVTVEEAAAIRAVQERLYQDQLRELDARQELLRARLQALRESHDATPLKSDAMEEPTLAVDGRRPAREEPAVVRREALDCAR